MPVLLTTAGCLEALVSTLLVSGKFNVEDFVSK